MGWDNRVFNANGRGLDMLTAALELVSTDGNSHHGRFSGSIVIPDVGLVWLCTDYPGASMYPVRLTAKQAAEISFAWLQTKEAMDMKVEDWDRDCDHDGDNSSGWRVFVGGWGHVDPVGRAAICAVKSVFLWHGK